MVVTSLLNLIECFKKLPGIGEKTAERLALSILDTDNELIDLFSTSLIDVKTKIKRCNICNNLSEEDCCEICKNTDRNKKIIGVVNLTEHAGATTLVVQMIKQLNINLF